MTVYVLTASRTVTDSFRALARGRSVLVEHRPVESLDETRRLAESAEESFVYLDADGLEDTTLRKGVRALARSCPRRFGIIDERHEVADVAELFRLGAVDYVGKKLLASGLSAARLRRIAAAAVPGAEQARVSTEQGAVPSGGGWTGVQDGNEYTFLMLYAGLDGVADLRRKASEGSLRTLRARFQRLLERSFAAHAARVWMWKEDDGLVLMPFDGRNVGAIVPAIRLLLNRVIINVDEFGQFDGIGWRLALHLGETTYRKSGRTGAIVSESVNFIFHLGQRFVGPGELVLTEAVHSLTPSAIRSCFAGRGSFESQGVFALSRRDPPG